VAPPRGKRLLPAYDQPHPVGEAAEDQPTATPADSLAKAGLRAQAEYTADPEADDVVNLSPDPHHASPAGDPQRRARPAARPTWCDSNYLIPKRRIYYT